MYSVPESFADRIIRMRGEKGAAWLKSIPDTVAWCRDHWRLKILSPFSLSYNYVAPVLLNDGSSGVLKLCIPGNECVNEIRALKFYNGEPMCRLIDSVEEAGILLLERLTPGTDLRIHNEDTSIHVVASLIGGMKKRAVAFGDSFQSTSGFAEDFMNMKKHFMGHDEVFTEAFVTRVESLYNQLRSTEENIYLLHGDLHHENILSCDAGWRLIDPKGIIGEPALEIIPFLMNHLPGQNLDAVIDHRIKRLSQELHLDTERICKWGLCRSVLSVWWNIEDNIAISPTLLNVVKVFDRQRTRLLD